MDADLEAPPQDLTGADDLVALIAASNKLMLRSLSDN
jgi:hypothetical protein